MKTIKEADEMVNLLLINLLSFSVKISCVYFFLGRLVRINFANGHRQLQRNQCENKMRRNHLNKFNDNANKSLGYRLCMATTKFGDGTEVELKTEIHLRKQSERHRYVEYTHSVVRPH